MIIYRPHRGSLKASMSDVVAFNNEAEMKEWISADSAKAFGVPMFSPYEIIISDEAISDSRTGWNDTRYVCVKRYGSEVFTVPQCIGMCATDFCDNKKLRERLLNKKK